MNLETDAGRKLANPSASQIAEELEALSGRADSYAILSRDERSYIQAAGGPSEGFLLEYQEGSIEQHYRSTQSNLPLTTVTNAFQLYAADDSSWRSLVPWEHDDLSQHSGGLRLLPLFLIVAALAGLALWWWRAA